MRKVIIMRGISGAGKSTWRKTYVPEAFVVSADLWFYDKDGNYNFEAKDLGKAHSFSKEEFKKALVRGEPLVVVDNTNTKLRDFRFYVDVARNHGYKVQYVRLETPVDVAAKRNVHGVPLEAVQRMKERLVPVPDDWYGEEIVVSGVS